MHPTWGAGFHNDHCSVRVLYSCLSLVENYAGLYSTIVLVDLPNCTSSPLVIAYKNLQVRLFGASSPKPHLRPHLPLSLMPLNCRLQLAREIKIGGTRCLEHHTHTHYIRNEDVACPWAGYRTSSAGNTGFSCSRFAFLLLSTLVFVLQFSRYALHNICSSLRAADIRLRSSRVVPR